MTSRKEAEAVYGKLYPKYAEEAKITHFSIEENNTWGHYILVGVEPGSMNDLNDDEVIEGVELLFHSFTVLANGVHVLTKEIEG